MLRIRLSRVGRKHDPSYRMIVTERGRGPQTGNYVEQVGTYDARTDEHELKSDRIAHWLSVGAKPSDTVHNLLVKTGILDADTINPLPQKSPVTSDPVEESEDANELGDPEDQVDEDESTEDTPDDAPEGDEEEAEESAEDNESEEVESSKDDPSNDEADESGNEAKAENAKDEDEESEEEAS